MEQAPCISQIATLLADPKRTAMIWALMDGSAKPSEELAMLAGLSASSANAHLARLAAGGLLRIEARGRKRFFRMAAADVAAAVDALASTTMASVARSAPSRSVAVLLAPALLRQARLCHDHLGGEMAAALYQRMVLAKWIERFEQRIHVTPLGARHLAEHGIFTQALAHQSYATMACDCYDWSEQQPHLGGALGAGLLQLFMQSRWLQAISESSALQVTETGRLEIARMAAV
ncbi:MULTISPECIES: ArsR/SmtB family transcription factor [Pseudomonas]|uniref:ArsR/SmtB family transcription factor n=1 Tax=Pseudomonas TaxID=286 RepID=UPI000CF3035E|nr:MULTISPECIES: helix-turn-helix transcriptional regulator [Pseudomonas]NMZ23620.1 helix-turn-helix transcriptional regulator [Pseudomonas proteolytica]